ncbi:hypothetical protein DIPPA_56651 [Diplonema papillatum]|nr:hypothetical protein DIPPA_56651 [Diplonema papillatum]
MSSCLDPAEKLSQMVSPDETAYSYLQKSTAEPLRTGIGLFDLCGAGKTGLLGSEGIVLLGDQGAGKTQMALSIVASVVCHCWTAGEKARVAYFACDKSFPAQRLHCFIITRLHALASLAPDEGCNIELKDARKIQDVALQLMRCIVVYQPLSLRQLAQDAERLMQQVQCKIEKAPRLAVFDGIQHLTALHAGDKFGSLPSPAITGMLLRKVGAATVLCISCSLNGRQQSRQQAEYDPRAMLPDTASLGRSVLFDFLPTAVFSLFRGQLTPIRISEDRRALNCHILADSCTVAITASEVSVSNPLTTPTVEECERKAHEE